MKSPRDTLRKYHGPGVWEDVEGGLHFSIPDLLAHFELEDTLRNRAAATRIMMDALRQNLPENKIVFREKPDDETA